MLGNDAIETLAHGYLLALPLDQLDTQRFERLVVRARELLGLGEADRAAYKLTEALTLWRGSPFSELEAFDVDDSDRFFGRQGDVHSSLEVLRRTNLTGAEDG